VRSEISDTCLASIVEEVGGFEPLGGMEPSSTALTSRALSDWGAAAHIDLTGAPATAQTMVNTTITLEILLITPSLWLFPE
jgi:hypothetical protein